MSTENNQGRWEFDENGNVHYVPSGEEDQTPVDGSYRISSRKSQPVSENPYWKNINRSNQRSAKADDGWHWILIILGFVGAWPIGLFLLLLQISGKWPSSKKLNMEAGRAMATDLAQIIYVYRKRAPQETQSMISLAQGNDFFEFARKYDEAREAAERKQKAEEERKAREAARREHDAKIAKMVERTTGVCPNESNGRCLTHLKGCPYFFNGHCEIVSRRKASA